jgi:hypothetical protein
MARRQARPAPKPAPPSSVPKESAASGPRLEIPPLAVFALIAAAIVVLQIPGLPRTFFADDFLFLDQVRSRTLFESLQVADPLSNFYRPVSRQIYFWILSTFTNESGLAFHVSNLFFFVVLVGVFYLVARRLAGTVAATIGTAFLALHYSGDVPVRWACGSQELLSVGGALAALYFHLGGRRFVAAGFLAVAALSKEIVLLTPLIAAIADRRPGESIVSSARRAWPLGIGVAVWAGVWLLAPHTRQAAGTEVEFHPWGPVSTYLHLFQVFLGVEARQGEMWRLPRVGPPIVPLVLAAAAVFFARGERRQREEEAKPVGNNHRHAILTGILWALLATVPIIAVAVLWSAYYYLYAMCGAALALGAALSRVPRPWAVAAVAVLAWGSASARHLDEFTSARNPWSAMSHINRFYIERATRICEGYLEDLRGIHPEFPKRSTLFFAGLKPNVAFQVADGPLIRWAYRDSSLRSYYLTGFSRDKASRGPNYFFISQGDSIFEMADGEDRMLRISMGMLVSDWPPGARDALALELEQSPQNQRARYWSAWASFALEKPEEGKQALTTAGYTLDAGPSPEYTTALRSLSTGDTLGALAIARDGVQRHALDPAMHGLFADLILIRDADDPDGAVEALAARVLAPDEANAWRRWGMVQARKQRYLEALNSFEKYFALAGPAGENDTEAKQWTDAIRRVLPGGAAKPEGLRE